MGISPISSSRMRLLSDAPWTMAAVSFIILLIIATVPAFAIGYLVGGVDPADIGSLTWDPGSVAWVSFDGVHEPTLIQQVVERFRLPPLIGEDLIGVGRLANAAKEARSGPYAFFVLMPIPLIRRLLRRADDVKALSPKARWARIGLAALGLDIGGERFMLVSGSMDVRDGYLPIYSRSDKLISPIYKDPFWSPRQQNNWNGLGKWTWNMTPTKKLSLSASRQFSISQGFKLPGEGYPRDFMEKVQKAAAVRGPSYIHCHSPCPTGWTGIAGSGPRRGARTTNATSKVAGVGSGILIRALSCWIGEPTRSIFASGRTMQTTRHLLSSNHGEATISLVSMLMT